MKIAVDAHVHLYPDYNLSAALLAGIINLSGSNRALSAAHEECVKLLFLTERSDCRIFAKLARDELQISGFRRVSADHEIPLIMQHESGAQIGLLPGRQIISSERIELLGYLQDIEIPDRRFPAAEVINRIHAAGGVPAINWAPGKWLFERGRIISRLLDQNAPGKFIFCDTALRPRLCPRPRILRRASERGFGAVYGSDPLPLPGEEPRVGRYGTALAAQVTGLSVEALRQLLLQPHLSAQPIGAPLAPAQVLLRLLRLKLTGKKKKGQPVF